MPNADELNDQPQRASSRLQREPYAQIEPESVRWLWQPRIPIAALTLLAGRQGLGKSTLTMELAARVTRGELRGDFHGKPSHVLVVTFEDDTATTLVPRAMVAGADLDLISQMAVAEHEDLENPLITLPDDLSELERHARDVEARLVIIDPIVASLPLSIDAHRDQDVRRALGPIRNLAERCDLSVLGLIHWNKGASTDALTRLSGSTAFSAAARSVLAFGTAHQEDDDGRRVLAHAKTNVGPIARSVEYKLEPAVLPRPDYVIDTVRLRPLGECDVTPGQLLAGQEGEQSKLDDATAFLRDALEDGRWHPKDEVKQAAIAQRIALRTLMRAVNKLGVEFERKGFPARGQWRLPPVVPTLFEE